MLFEPLSHFGPKKYPKSITLLIKTERTNPHVLNACKTNGKPYEIWHCRVAHIAIIPLLGSLDLGKDSGLDLGSGLYWFQVRPRPRPRSRSRSRRWAIQPRKCNFYGFKEFAKHLKTVSYTTFCRFQKRDAKYLIKPMENEYFSSHFRFLVQKVSKKHYVSHQNWADKPTCPKC